MAGIEEQSKIKNEKQLEEMSEAAGALGKPNATRDIVDRILEISQ